MFTWYRGDFHPGASSLRFPLVALYSFTWYQSNMSCRRESYRREFTPFLCRREIFIPARKFIPVSCKRGMTVRFIFIKISSILRHYKTRTPTNTALCKHGATFHLAPEWKSRHYHVNTPQKTTATEKPTWNRQEEWPVNAAHLLNQRIAKSFCFRPLTDVLTRKSNAPPGGPHFGSNSPLYGA